MSSLLENTGPNPARSGLAEILYMAFPIIVGMASATVMQFVDFWMVSGISVSAAAAVGPAGILSFAVVSFLVGTLSCTNTFVSQSFARGQHPDCSRYTWQGLYIALFGGAAALVLWPLTPKLIALLGNEPDLQPLETVYFRVRLLSVGSMAAITALSGFFQGTRRPRLAMYAALVGNVFNVGANWVFIYGNLGFPKMGVAGAALGTVLASLLQAGMMLFMFLSRRDNRDYKSRSVWRLDRVALGQLFRIGWPAGVQFILDVGCWGIFVAVILGRMGPDVLAASNIAGQMLQVSFMPTVGLSIAVTALVGQYVGRRDFATARARAHTALLLGMGYMATMGLVFLLLRSQLVLLFRTEPNIVTLGGQILILCAVFQIFDAMGIVASGALKGAGDTRFPAAVFILYGWFFFVPSAYLMTYVLGWGALGAWGGACIYIIALGMTLLWRWRSGSWEKIDVFRTKEALAVQAQPVPPPLHYEAGDELP